MSPTNSHKRTEQQLIKIINFAAKNGTTIVLNGTDAAILCSLIGEDKMEKEDDKDGNTELQSEEW